MWGMKPQLEKQDYYGTIQCRLVSGKLSVEFCRGCSWFYREKCQREGLLLEGKEK